MSSDKYIKRIAVSTHLGTGLYTDECCNVGPCTLAPGHAGSHRDHFEAGRYHPIDGKAGEIDVPASFAAYAVENEAAASKIFDDWFLAGFHVAEQTWGEGPTPLSPYAAGSVAHHWWTRGFAHATRLLRAIEAERSLAQ